MQSKILLAALVLALLSSAIPAQERRATTVHGLGSHSCAKFAEDYRRQRLLTEVAYFSWAQGFMSGWNTAMQVAKATSAYKVRNLNGIDLSEQKAIVRDYCDTHPLQAYYRAVVDLYSRLPILD